MYEDGTVIATGLDQVLTALIAAGVPDDGAIDDLIGSARMDGGCYYGSFHVAYENLTYRLEWEDIGEDDPDEDDPDEARRWAEDPDGMFAAELRSVGLSADAVAFHVPHVKV